MRRLVEIPTDFGPRYFCPKCGSAFGSWEGAVACDASDGVPGYGVGSIVLVDLGYCWYDGDEKWLIENPPVGGERRSYSCYMVVTAVDYERDSPYRDDVHTPRYHLKTLGIKNGNETGLAGWNRPGSHYPMHLGLQHPELVEEGARFIGERSERML